MIWVLVQVHSGIADSVETFTTEVSARKRIEELLIDLDWNDDNLNLFAGDLGSELKELNIELNDFETDDVASTA